MSHGTALRLAGCWLLACLASGASREKIDLTLEPAEVEIGIFYNGVQLIVSAEVEPGVEVAVLMTGPWSELRMRKKERLWGLFWAPSGEVEFENVPSLYLLRTSAELRELASEDELRELGLGYEALRSPIEEGPGENLFQELVRLKESEGLFSFSAMAARLESRPGGERQEVRVTLPVPANAPAATYRVQLLGFSDKRLVTRGEAAFDLRQTRVTAFVSSLAREHGLLYGLLAVVAALAAGLGVGLLFGPAKKH